MYLHTGFKRMWWGKTKRFFVCLNSKSISITLYIWFIVCGGSFFSRWNSRYKEFNCPLFFILLVASIDSSLLLLLQPTEMFCFNRKQSLFIAVETQTDRREEINMSEFNCNFLFEQNRAQMTFCLNKQVNLLYM